MRPAIPPFDAVDQQDPAAVDLVFLALPRLVHVDCVIDDPHLPRLVHDDGIVPRGEPAFAFEEHQAVGYCARLLERLERPRWVA